MNAFGQLLELVAYILPISAPGLADVDNYVQFLPAVVQRLSRFGELDGSCVSAMRKANGGAGIYSGSRKHLSATGKIVGQDANACNVITNHCKYQIGRAHV